MWLAWHIQHLRLNLRGRRGAFSSYIDVRGSLATNWSLGRRCFLCGWRGRRCFLCDWRGTFSTSGSICVAGVVLSVHRCPRKLGDELVTWTPLLSVWLAWHIQHLRLNLRGRRGAFSSYIDVRGSLATNWSLGRRCCLCGWRGTFSA